LGIVAPVCNPRYSRGRDQEDHSLRLACTKKCNTLSEKKKKPKVNRAWGVVQVIECLLSVRLQTPVPLQKEKNKKAILSNGSIDVPILFGLPYLYENSFPYFFTFSPFVSLDLQSSLIGRLVLIFVNLCLMIRDFNLFTISYP
jgi:hypothetical protein